MRAVREVRRRALPRRSRRARRVVHEARAGAADARRVRRVRDRARRGRARPVRAALLLRLRGRRPDGGVGVPRRHESARRARCARCSAPTSATGTCPTWRVLAEAYELVEDGHLDPSTSATSPSRTRCASTPHSTGILRRHARRGRGRRGTVALMKAEELEAIYERTRNWGRWGADDERGALNFLTAEHRRAAAAACARAWPSASRTICPSSRAPRRPAPRITTCSPRATRVDAERDPGLRGPPRLHRHRGPRARHHAHGRAVPHVRARRDVQRPPRVATCTSDGARTTRSCRGRRASIGRGVLLDVPARCRRATFLEGGVGDAPPSSKRPSERRGSRVGRGRHPARSRLGATPGARGEGGPESVQAGPRRVCTRHCLPWLHERRSQRSAATGSRTNAVHFDPRLAVPDPPDRHHRHRPPPDRQLAPRAARRGVRARGSAGTFLFTAAPIRMRRRHRLTAQPGGGVLMRTLLRGGHGGGRQRSARARCGRADREGAGRSGRPPRPRHASRCAADRLRRASSSRPASSTSTRTTTRRCSGTRRSRRRRGTASRRW